MTTKLEKKVRLYLEKHPDYVPVDFGVTGGSCHNLTTPRKAECWYRERNNAAKYIREHGEARDDYYAIPGAVIVSGAKHGGCRGRRAHQSEYAILAPKSLGLPEVPRRSTKAGITFRW